MAFKYKTINWQSALIKKVEIDRETNASIWINGRRSTKSSNYDKYWDSWDEAYIHLLHRAERAVEVAKQRLEVSEQELSVVKELGQEN